MGSDVRRVVDSWRGVRPTLHYSISREEYFIGHARDIMPDMSQLLNEGYKKQKLRAHSDFYWNTKVNEWALSFLNTHDIMCESKGKNLASFALYEQAKQLTLL
jgi:UV DNA damage endonuclease